MHSSKEDQHRVTVRLPGTSFPFLEERCIVNRVEADALLRHAKEHPRETFHAVSPFMSQCLLLSRLVQESGIRNVTVFTLDRLGAIPFSGNPPLLVSMVIGRPDPGYPKPVQDYSRLLEIFAGEYSRVLLFCTPEAAKGHPLLSALVARPCQTE